VVGRFDPLLFVVGVRVDHDLERIEDREAPLDALVQILADAGLELTEFGDSKERLVGI